MEKNTNNRNILFGILAGAAAGAAIGFYVAHKREHETGHQIRESILDGVKQVALAKGIEIIDELMQKYADRRTHTAETHREAAAA